MPSVWAMLHLTPNAELESTMIVSFDQCEIDRMNVNKLSLELRETRNVRLALETIINSLPATQQGTVDTVTPDIQTPSRDGFLPSQFV